MSDIGSAPGQGHPHALRMYTLGRFALEVNGEPLRLRARAQRKPLGVIKALAALGGEHVPVAALTESLWPDSEGDQAYRAFTVTLNRLRKLVGQGVVHLEDGRLSLDPETSWVDSREFANLLGAADRALATGQGEQAWLLFQRALRLYEGPFLDGEFEPPEVLSARERLHGLLLRHIEQMGRFLRDTKRVTEALHLYQRGLEIDGLAEDICRSLMRCLHEQERAAEALAVYQRFCNTLQAQMGIEPSSETEALRRNIAEDSRAVRSAAALAPPPDAAANAGRPADVAPAPEVLTTESAIAPAPGFSASTSPQDSMEDVERRMVTIAFADLVGYTSLTEHLDPESLDELIGRIRAAATDVVNEQGGIINQFAGDEVMALFGVPAAQEDDARRAIAALRQLNERVEQIGREVFDAASMPLLLHSGADTGWIVVRPIEGPGGRYGVTGPAVVTASRLASLAKPGEILVGPETNKRVTPFFRCEPLQLTMLKGQSAPLRPHRVVGTSHVRSAIDAARTRGLTGFVGRDTELGVLQEALRSAEQGHGRIVTVEGDAGMGKSRLLFEFRHSAPLDSFSVLLGNCRPHGRKVPYLPFLSVLRQGLHLRPSDTPERLADKVKRATLAISPQLEPYVPHFLHLLSIRDPSQDLTDRLTGEELRVELEQAIAAIITMNLQHRPMLVIFEDWHWSDEASDSLVKRVGDVIAEYPLLLLVSYRPEYHANWGSLPHRSHIELAPLNAVDAERLVHQVAGQRPMSRELVGSILERAEGNPLYIEELARAVLEQTGLSTASQQTQAASDGNRLRLPDSVHAIVRTRMDRLEPGPRSVLRLASVIGSEFSGAVLERLMPRAQGLQRALETLKQHELIQQTRLFPERLFRFSHAITHEAVYDTLLVRQRRKLHEQVGEAIEALHADNLDAHYEALAFHFGNSANHAKALTYLERAGDKAAVMFSLVEARKHYRTAVGRIASLPARPELQRRRCDLVAKWGQVSFYSPSRDLIGALEAALQDAHDLDDPERIARITFWDGMLNYALGKHDVALDRFERCLAMSKDVGPEIHVLTINYLGRVQFYRAEFAHCIENLRKGIPLLQKRRRIAEAVNSMSLLVLTYAFMGEFKRIPELAAQIDAAVAGVRNPTAESMGALCIGIADLLHGHWARALASLKNAGTRSHAIGNSIMEGLALFGEGFGMSMQVGYAAGLERMVEGIAMIESTDSHLGLSAFYGLIGEVYARMGQLQRARASANKVFLVCGAGEKLGECSAYTTLAIAAAHGSNADWSEAQAYMKESLRISRARNLRPLLARSLMYFAELHHEHGELDQARTYLRESRALFKDMAMDFWLERSEGLQAVLQD